MKTGKLIKKLDKLSKEGKINDEGVRTAMVCCIVDRLDEIIKLLKKKK